MRTSQYHFLVHSKRFRTELRAIIAALNLILLLYGFGCANPNYGGFRRSQDVTQAFETYHVYPQHRYYYLNLENSPYAVMALNKRFTLTGKQWQEFDPQTEKLKKIVDLVKQFPDYWYYTYGSYMVDASGNRVGYWYSSLRIRGLKVNHQTQTVSVFTDTPWLRDREREFGRGMEIRIGP